jgi:hypothetical protein
MAKNRRVTIPKSLVDTFVRVWNEDNNYKVCEEYINCGWCYQFAIVIKRALNCKVDLYTDYDGGHCWVKIGNYFYDSEHLNGTKHNLTMSTYGNDWKGPVAERTIQRLWAGANSGPVQIYTINRVIAEWKHLTRR